MRRFPRFITAVRSLSAFAVCAAVGASAVEGRADVSDVFFSIHASSGEMHGVFQVLTEDVSFNPDTDTWTWFGSGISVNDDVTGDQIAVLNNAFVMMQADPQVNLVFNVQAGGADTAFFISTGTLAFPAIADPIAQASVGFTLTDSDPFGAGDGEASLVGDGPGGHAFIAEYNLPPGTIYTQQLQSLIITGDPSGSTSFNVNDPPVGFNPIAGPATNMRAYTQFTLSAFDQASSTSQFTIIPEPIASLGLLFGGLMLLRRR